MRDSRESGNPGNPARLREGTRQRSAARGGEAFARNYAVTQNPTVIPAQAGTSQPPLPRPSVIPAQAGTQETPARLREGTRERSEARGRRTFARNYPRLPNPPSFPGRREPRNPRPSAGGGAPAQRSAGEEKRSPATTPVTPNPPSFPRKREPRNPPPVCGRGSASAAMRRGGEAFACNYPRHPNLTRHSRAGGNPGNPRPSAGGDAPAQRSAGEEKRSPATTPVPPPPPPTSVIPAQAGTSQPSLPPSFPRKRESRHRHPSHRQRPPQQVRGEPVEPRGPPTNPCDVEAETCYTIASRSRSSEVGLNTASGNPVHDQD